MHGTISSKDTPSMMLMAMAMMAKFFYGNDGNGNSYLCLGMLANKLVSKEEIESKGGRSIKHPFLLWGDFLFLFFHDYKY